MLLLRLRHWQAFLLVFVLPFLLRYVLSQLLTATGLAASAILYTLVDALPTVVPMLWLWRVGLHFYRRLPDCINISAVYFNLGVLYFTLYILVLIYTLGVLRESLSEGILPLGLLALLLPMHLFATFCYLYVAYFVGRCIVSVEKQRIVATNEYFLPVIQAAFLPIGIWFLQPRLNRLLQ